MDWKKKIVSLLLTICLVAGMFPAMSSAVGTEESNMQIQAAGLPFTDVPQKEWYYDAVKYVYENNLMVGSSDTKFEPQKTMTRAMVAQILYSKEGRPVVSGEPIFRDVKKSEWYYNAIQWASQNGVAHGMGDGTFKPNGYVTREQFAQFMYSYAGSPKVSGTLSFPDAKKVSDWAVNAMLWATQNKLINGDKMPNGQILLDPQGRTTRAQAAVILRGFCENIAVAEEQYSITDLVVSGKTVTVEVTAPRACTVQVTFLHETTEKTLNVTATASVPANIEMGTVQAMATGLLPTHFIAVVQLLDTDGKQLCNPFKCIKYTSNYEKFEEQTVDDFKDDTVINFDNDKTDNFGVLVDTIKKPSAATGKNIITENANGTYTVKNIDSTVKALKAGDEALFFDKNGEEVLVSIATIKISGTTATITRNADATLEDFYQVLKVDMSVGAKPEYVDTKEADAGVTLLNQKDADENVRSSQKGMEIIDEDIDLCQSLSFGLAYETDHFKTEGNLELKELITVEITYDAKLFGKDYLYCEMQSETKGSFSIEVKAKIDNYDSVKEKTDEETIQLGEVPFPLGYGFSCSVSLTVPVEISLEGGAKTEASYSIKSGFIYSTTDGKHNVSSKSFDVNFIQAEAKFEVKAGPKLAVSIEFMKDVLKGEISGQIGGDFTATLQTGSVDATNADSIHACALCVDGDIYKFANVKVKLSYQITKHLKGTPFSTTIVEGKYHLNTFYVSISNEADSPLGGHFSFGLGDCPNKKYRTTFNVKDVSGNEVSGAQISVNKGTTNVGTVQNGKTLYLYNGDYEAQSTVNKRQLTKKFTVKDKKSTVTLREKNDVLTDPDNPDPDNPDPENPDPSDVVASGKCGDNLTWTLDTNGKLLVEGNGKMYDWAASSYVPWYEVRNRIKTTVIGNGVTSIGACAFLSCRLTSVTISNSVTSIGKHAFGSCSSLASVTIPDSVIRIDDYAFDGCSNLTSVTIPDSVTSIGENAFSDCYGLTAIDVDAKNTAYSSVNGVLFNKNKTTLIRYPNGKSGVYTIPNSVTRIGKYAFNSCRSLTSVTIPSSVTSIGDSAFMNCSNLTSVTIPSSVTIIDDFAFMYCSNLTSVTIPSSVTYIGIAAFNSCSSLTNVTIPSSVTRICDHAFMDCSNLTSVTIPSSVTSIGDSAFMNCTKLTDVYYRGSETQWAAIFIDGYNDPLKYATIHYNS